MLLTGLPQFSADLDWLKEQGNEVLRFNLTQGAAEFVKNATVQDMLATEGVECLPLVIVDDRIVSRGKYPTRENLAIWSGTVLKSQAKLPIADDSGGCCGDTSCCSDRSSVRPLSEAEVGIAEGTGTGQTLQSADEPLPEVIRVWYTEQSGPQGSYAENAKRTGPLCEKLSFSLRRNSDG